MTTEAMQGRREHRAIQRIEDRLDILSGGRMKSLPRKSRFGHDMLRVLQLEAIADQLDLIELPKVKSKYQDMKLEALKKIANERGGTLTSFTTKATLIAALDAADKAAEEAKSNA